jgi:type II secretion system protein C
MKKRIDCEMNYLRLIILLILLPILPTKSWGNNPNTSIPLADSPQVPSRTQQTQNEFWKYLELVGIVIDEPEGKNLAFIEDKRNEHQDVYSIGTNVPGGAKVLKITNNGVLLERDGLSHKLELRQSINDSGSDETGYKKLSSNEWKLNARKMFPGLWDVVKTFKGVRVAKFRRSDGGSGLRVNELSDDHLLKNIGLEEGDIVEEINGQHIDNTSDLLDYLWGLDNQSDIVVSLDRQGKKTKLKYHTSSNEPSYSRRQVKQAAQKTGLMGVTAKVSW